MVNCECVLSTCKKKKTAEMAALKKEGWKRITASTEHGPPNNRWRTHLGWCPDCAKKFSVE